MTDTAVYADYVLPATTQLEHLDLAYSWGTPYVALNVPTIAPRGEALPNSRDLPTSRSGDGPHGVVLLRL